MTQTNPQCIHLSASAIGSLKACPQRFRLAYREGLRTATDTDAQRQGTAWHAMHEVYADTIANCQVGIPYQPDNENDTPRIGWAPAEAAMNAVTDHLNRKYAECPQWKTIEEWGLERTILLTCFIGYLWYYQNDPIEVLASEVPFDLPLHMPKTGLPLPLAEVMRVGKIDHLIRWQEMFGALERKSTSRSIAPDSDYWDKSKKDTQVSMYALALRDMMENEQLGELHYNRPGRPELKTFGTTLYDVWHKPTIKPTTLSQKDTAAFIESGVYCGQNFQVAFTVHPDFSESNPHLVSVDGQSALVEMGKKGFAVRETLEMYSARLLADIYERPDFYFQRREIARTDAEIRKFRGELYSIYQTMKTFSKSGHWYENEQQCRATFPCQYIPICYGPGADAVCDGKTTPPGFKRIFVDLKVNGESLED